MTRYALLVVLAASTPAVSSAADLSRYPERPIRLIVPQAPGSSSDTLARIVATGLARQIGQQIVVDKRPGGALIIGMELIARAVPDGYTIGYAPIGALPQQFRELIRREDVKWRAVVARSGAKVD